MARPYAPLSPSPRRTGSDRWVARGALWIFLSTVVLPACRETQPGPRAWTDLFDIRDTVVLAPTFAHLVKLDTLQYGPDGRISRWRLTEPVPAHVSVSALRVGRLEPFRGGRDEAATLGGLAPFSQRLGASLLRKPDIVGEVPYWVSLPYSQVAAQGGSRIYVASNLFYPIYVFDFERHLVDSLATPPPSWQRVRRTQFGKFSNDRRGDSAYARFLESFSIIADMAVVGDSVLVVTHGRYRRENHLLRIVSDRSDTYVSGTRIATDLPSPGAMLAYSHGSIFFLSGGPPESSWHLIEYRWRDNH